MKLKDKVERCIQSHLSIEEDDQENISIANSTTEESAQPSETSFYNKHLHTLKAITEPVASQPANYDNDSTKLPFYSPANSFLLNTNSTTTTTTSNNSTNINIKRSSLLTNIRSTNQNSKHLQNTTKITINVYLLPDCCYDEESLVSGGDCLLENQEEDLITDFELLESWSINMISNQKSEQQSRAKLLTLNELFQAIRSYLHFSQISSWMNQSGGLQPKNIAYRYSHYKIQKIKPFSLTSFSYSYSFYLTKIPLFCSFE